MVFSTAYPRIRVSAYPLHNIPRSLLGEEWYFRLRIRVSAYPLHNILRSLLGEEWYFRLRIRVSAYPLHNIPRSLLGEEWYFRLRIRVSAYPLHNILRSLLGEEWYFRLRIRVSAYPLHNIPRSLLGEEWYFPLCIRVSAYPLHNILLRSLLGEGCYFRLRMAGYSAVTPPSVSLSHFFSRTSFYQDKYDIAQSSNATGRMEEAALSEIIFAMKNVPGLFEIYENFKGTVPMVQRHRVEIFYCVTNIAMGELEQKELLTSELSQNGKNSLFLELLDQITKEISESSERDLAFILWSVGRLIDIVGEMNDLVHACEAEILSRDLKAFDNAAVNQILTGLAACRKKDSEIWSKVEKSILSGEIKITDFSNAELVGSLMGFSKARSVTSELFEHYREAIESHKMPSFKDFELSQMVFAFAKKGVEAEKLYSYTEQEILLRGIKGFLDKNLFLIPWAFANYKSNRRYDQIFQLIDEEFFLRGVQGCSNGVISNLVWCFSKVGLCDAEIFDVVKNEVLVRGVESFHRDYPQLLWSFARAKGSAYPDLSDNIVSWFLSTDLSPNHTKDLCLYTSMVLSKTWNN